jgi:hypothetical protein
MAVNLPTFSTEDHQVQPYQVDDFNRCAELVGARVKLKPGSGYQARSINANEPPPGVAAQETEDLALRPHRMARLGRLVAQSGDANQAWFEDDALDDGTAFCGDLVATRGGHESNNGGIHTRDAGQTGGGG